MGKSFTWLALGAMLSLFPLLTPGCMRVGAQVSKPDHRHADFSVRNFVFDMGGVDITIPLPAGYAEAPPAVRQAVAAGLQKNARRGITGSNNLEYYVAI